MKTILLGAALLLVVGVASAASRDGTLVACGDTANTTASSAGGLISTASGESSSQVAEDEGSASAEPAARAEARGERAQVDDEALW